MQGETHRGIRNHDAIQLEDDQLQKLNLVHSISGQNRYENRDLISTVIG